MVRQGKLNDMILFIHLINSDLNANFEAWPDRKKKVVLF